MMSAAHGLQQAPAAARSQDLHFAFVMAEALVGRVRICDTFPSSSSQGLTGSNSTHNASSQKARYGQSASRSSQQY